jgi:DNA-binding NarL/FixJ family response regulator
MAVGRASRLVHPCPVAPISVVVVERERAVAQAIAYRLDSEPELAVVAIAHSAAGAVLETELHRPDVVVLDETVAEIGLTTLAAKLRQAHPSHILIVTAPHEDLARAYESVQAGAAGFVTKLAGIDEMIRAVSGAARGESWFPPRLLTGVLRALQSHGAGAIDDDRIGRLTGREREVLACMMAGLDRVNIARRLVVSVNTVRTHTQHVLAKLEAHSSLEAVSIALRAGFVSDVDSDSGVAVPTERGRLESVTCPRLTALR